jgi:hypothetical protein
MQNIEINFGVRPCIVTQNGEEKKALFHMWNNFAKPVAADVYAGGCPEGQISIVFGIVEYEDGSVDEVRPAQIRFVDNKIKGYAFEED